MVIGNSMRPKLRYAVAVAMLASFASSCAGDADPPKGFGVNVTVDAREVPEAERKRIVRARLLASVGTPADLPDANVKGIQSGELRFRFLPATKSGPLVLTLEAFDVAGAMVARGESLPVEINPTAAVAAAIKLVPDSRKAIATACASNEECSSNFCADGVCCDKPCKGTCESCALPTALGVCTPVPEDTDPELECVPRAPAAPAVDAGAGGVDAGATDGGTQLNVPDGGLMGNTPLCAGKCDGQRKCKFPGPTTSCGAKWCNEAYSPAGMVCNGAGSCEPQLSQCLNYSCADGACRTQCSKHEDCQTETHYCSINNTCLPKKGNSVACTVAGECASGHCYGDANGKVCCNTACGEAGMSCTEAPGKCKCSGVTCAEGVACQVYYRDADGDTFGDATGTTLNLGAIAGCAGLTPAGYVANNQDCDDQDANAKPGQSAFFTTPSGGRRSFDYDCDGKLTTETPTYGFNCNFHYGSECGQETRPTCKTAGNRAGNGCGLNCFGIRDPIIIGPPLLDLSILLVQPISPIISRCTAAPRHGFTTNVACGAKGTLRTCGTCAEAGGFASPSDATQTQGCR